MIKATVLINSIEAVKDFVIAATKQPYTIDINSGRYTVDAKSLMGVFSLNCSLNLDVVMHTDDATAFLSSIKQYIVK